MMFSLALNNCYIVDGSGNRPYLGSVAVSGTTIAAIHDQPLAAAEVVDGSGLVLAPGFVDIHSHSDVSLQIEPGAASRVMQGITTEVVGNCGFSPVPTGDNRELIRKAHGTRSKWLSWDWNDVDDYLRAIEDACPAVNVAFLIGHGTLRIAVMGYERRPATDVELEEMSTLLLAALDQGAAGLSSGLAYAPGLYATADEMACLTALCADRGKLYSTHVRNEGALLAAGVAEAVETCCRSKVRLQVSHVKLLGKDNWGKVEQIMDILDQGSARGVDLAVDCYPYEAGSTALTAFFPPWVHEGGQHQMKQLLSDRKGRARIRTAFAVGEPGWWNPARQLGWDRLIVSSCPQRPELVGSPISDLETDGDLVGPLCDLVVDCDGLVDVVAFGADERDLAEIVSSSLAVIGSDGLALAPGGSTGVGRPHPRSFGTFPRAYDLYVQTGRLSIEEAVAKMTLRPAERVGLVRRGAIRVGYAADLVLFDRNLLIDRATYEQPFQYPDGIVGVWVNGQRVVDRKTMTGVRAGSVLRL